MSQEKYTFNSFNVKHGYVGGPVVELTKQQVWDLIKNDKDFWRMKLYRIKVESISQQSSYNWPRQRVYNIGLHWARNLKEAKAIGEIIEQVHPKPPKPAKQRLGL